jgi:O-antigen/teichoic acid export membrane protein
MNHKLKQLSKDTAIYGISTILGRFLNFLLVPFYTYVFGRAEYGIVANIYSFIALLNIIYLYGFDVAFLRYSTNENIQTQKKYYSTAFLTVFFTSIIFSIFIFFTYEKYIDFIGITKDYSNLIIYMVIILFLDSLSAIPFTNLRIQRKAKIFASYKFINILTNVIFNIVFIVFLKYGIEAVLISNILASFITLILLLVDISKFFNLTYDKDALKKFLKFGIAFVPAGLASMVVQVIDRPILQKLTNSDVVGLYQANYKLGIFMMLFVSVFQYAWQPFLIANSKEKDSKDIISKVLTYFLILGSVILISLTFLIYPLTTTKIFGKSLINYNYWSGLYIVPIVLLGYLFNGVYVVLSAGILIKEKTFLAPVITGLGALVNVISNLLLIPRYSILGAAFSTFFSYFVMSFGMFIANQHYYHIKFEYLKIIKIFFLIGIFLTLYYKFYNLFITNILLEILAILVFILAIFIFKILKINAILNMKKGII